MIFNLKVDNSLYSIRLNWAMSHKKFGEKYAKHFTAMNPFTVSKLKRKEFAE